jgi:hypothetical protein
LVGDHQGNPLTSGDPAGGDGAGEEMGMHDRGLDASGISCHQRVEAGLLPPGDPLVQQLYGDDALWERDGWLPGVQQMDLMPRTDELPGKHRHMLLSSPDVKVVDQHQDPLRALSSEARESTGRGLHQQQSRRLLVTFGDWRAAGPPGRLRVGPGRVLPVSKYVVVKDVPAELQALLGPLGGEALADARRNLESREMRQQVVLGCLGPVAVRGIDQPLRAQAVEGFAQQWRPS